MATARKTAKRRRKRAPHRTREKLVQLYLSADELEAFGRLCSARGCSRSDLVRVWIKRADARRGITPKRADHDPRQLALITSVSHE